MLTPSVFVVPEHDVTIGVEIHFHDQEEASVFLEADANGESCHFAEVLLFVLFAVRQFTILGKPELPSLAAALLGVDSMIKDLAQGHELGGARIVPYPGHKGRKSLYARCTFSSKGIAFHSNTKGFGILSRGLGYYSPTAVFVLLRYLAIPHSSQEEYLAKLAQAAQLCGAFYLKDQISITNQTQVAATIVGSVLGGWEH